ncbi:MAG: LLM class flavin-dependent oxidoreductase [Ilumatobacteraceae bacterium]
MTSRLTGTGIWSGMLRYGDAAATAAAATELEAQGWAALWIPDVGGDLWSPLANLLGATSTVTIATGILNVWMHMPEEAAAEHARLVTAHGPRYLCGIGISHRPFIDHVNSPGTYTKPVETMAAYLDGLDAADTPLAKSDRVIAALGPKMLELARTRSAGTHPYLVTPELTAKLAGIGDGLVASERGGARNRPHEGSRDRPHAPRHLPRPAELREQLEAPGLHRRRHRERGQRPVGRRARGVG